MAEWLATYLLHSTSLLGATLLAVRLPGLRRACVRDALLRTALVAGLVTATLQPLAGVMVIPTGEMTTEISKAEAASVTSTPDPAAVPERFSPPSPNTSLVSEVFAARPSATPPFPWDALAVLLFGATSVLTLVRFGQAGFALRRVLAHSSSVDVEAARLEPFRRIRLLESGLLTVPLAVGRRTVVLPRGFRSSSLRAVLTHEVAHLRRRDPLWNIGLSLLSHLLAFQPLNFVALRAWRGASEEICDAHAVRITRDPLSLAQSLLDLTRRKTHSPLIAVGMVGRTHLSRRVEALLAEREVFVKPGYVALLVGVLLLSGSLLPALTFAQIGTLQRLEVVIDAGHGGAFEGGEGYANEAEVVLAVAKKVEARLKAKGVKVVMTRDTNTALAGTLREDINARKSKITPETDAFVSIHAGAAETPQPQGITTWVASEFASDDLEQNTLDLAHNLQAELVQQTGARDRGVQRNSFAVLSDAPVPAAMIELGFVTNPVEGAKLETDAYQEQLAEAISRAVFSFLAVDTSLLELQQAQLRLLHLNEAKAFCSGERTAERDYLTPDKHLYFPMPMILPDPDKKFFILPSSEQALQTCIDSFLENPESRTNFFILPEENLLPRR